MSKIKVNCFIKECNWEKEVSMENLTEELPVGMVKATLSVYKGNDQADEYRVTVCPEHGEKLMSAFKPRKDAVEGSGEALQAAAAAVAAEKMKGS